MMPPPVAARVQAVTNQEAQNAEGVVTGNFIVCGYLAHALFDLEATYSFIATSFVDKVGLKANPMHHHMSVSTPLRTVSVATEKCLARDVWIDSQNFCAELIVLDM